MRSSFGDGPSNRRDESIRHQRFNTRLGLTLFFIYIASYILLICVTASSGNSGNQFLSSPFANGLTLVVMAIILSVAYGMLRRDDQRVVRPELVSDSVELSASVKLSARGNTK